MVISVWLKFAHYYIHSEKVTSKWIILNQVQILSHLTQVKKNPNFCRSALAACFDRESRREKYLEQRNREIRLAKKHRDAKKKEIEDESVVNTGSVLPDKNTPVNPEQPTEDENLVLDRQFFVSLANMVLFQIR